MFERLILSIGYILCELFHIKILFFNLYVEWEAQ